MTLIQALLIALISSALALGQTPSEPIATYWLADNDPTTAIMYDPLLVFTTVPLDQIEANSSPPAVRKQIGDPKSEVIYILDQPAFFLVTHNRDSIWNSDRRPIKPLYCRMVEGNAGEIIFNERRYKITPAETADVIRLLQRPEGTVPLHRTHAPIVGAERTIRALLLLLNDQAEHHNDKGRTKR